MRIEVRLTPKEEMMINEFASIIKSDGDEYYNYIRSLRFERHAVWMMQILADEYRRETSPARRKKRDET